MRIGFITYEYPPDIAQGGIATYVEQAARILKDRGHDVEVFCGSHERTISEYIRGILIHRCKTNSPTDFKYDIYNIFNDRHSFARFDVIESPEIHANGLVIKEKFPELPLVVKLHMPLFLQMRLINYYTSKFTKLRFFLGALRRGRLNYFGRYEFKSDLDYKITSIADAIVSPSLSLKDIISREWHLPSKYIKVIPNPFNAPMQLLHIPVNNDDSKAVTFIGKLNVHKGIVALVKVIPYVVVRHPDVEFRFIGADSFFEREKMAMSDYIKKELEGLETNYTICGGLGYEEVIGELSSASVCIFPSIWENFPLVCLEAMSAGRAIIGSREGGMSDMLSEGAGILINPLSVTEISNAILKLLDNVDLRISLGNAARRKVVEQFNSEKIGEMMETQYESVIYG